MWISKDEWNNIQNKLNELKKYKENIERGILNMGDTKHGVLVEDVFIIHRDLLNTFEDTLNEAKKDIKNLKDQNLKLIAERDWYKNEYAKLLAKNN